MKTDAIVSITKHSNDTGNGAFAEALAKAVTPITEKEVNPISTEKEAISSSELPDLSDDTPPLSDEDLEKAAEEAWRKKEWAENAGAIRLAAVQERNRIRSTEGWDLVPELVERYNEITEKIRKIDEAGDENLHRHVEFAEFLNIIRSVETREQMDDVVARVVSEQANGCGATRYRSANKDEVHRLKSAGVFPDTAFFWRGDCYLPYEPEDGEEKTPGQFETEKAIMGAIRRLSMKKKKEIRRKTEELHLMDASEDLSGILDSVEGLYRVVVEPVRDSRNKKKVLHHGGVAIVRRTEHGGIEPVDGAGCYHWLSLEKGKWWIPVGMAIFAKFPKDFKASTEVREKAIELARILNRHGLFDEWKKRKDASMV